MFKATKNPTPKPISDAIVGRQTLNPTADGQINNDAVGNEKNEDNELDNLAETNMTMLYIIIAMGCCLIVCAILMCFILVSRQKKSKNIVKVMELTSVSSGDIPGMDGDVIVEGNVTTHNEDLDIPDLPQHDIDLRENDVANKRR